MRQINDSWCYKERNERNPAMRYTRVIYFREGTDWDQGYSKGSGCGRGPKCTNLIEDSMYYNKPVHYISIISEELE